VRIKLKNDKKQIFTRRTLGFSKSKKEMVAFANNHYAFVGWYINHIWAKQCSITFYLCFMLNYMFLPFDTFK